MGKILMRSEQSPGTALKDAQSPDGLDKRVILIHVYECIWPPNCGVHMRIWQVINVLQILGLQVHVISSDGHIPKRVEWPEAARRHLSSIGVQLHLAPFHAGSIDFWLAATHHTWERRVLRQSYVLPSSRYFFRPQLERLWGQIIERERVDATIVNYAFWSRLTRISKSRGVWSAIEMIDLLTAHYRAARALNGSVSSGNGDADSYLEDELRCLAMADCVLAINPEEGANVRNRLKVPVIDLPFCMDLPTYSIGEAVTSELLVVGSDNEYNKRGLRQFIEGAWPAIKAARPGIRLTVCGRVGEDLENDPNITRLIRVPDLAPYYQGAKVVLLTAVAGAGIKIKAIEAFSHSSCILAHQHSVAGTPFCSGVHGETLENLIGAAPIVLRLLDEPERQALYRTNAGALFRKQYESGHGREILRKMLAEHLNVGPNR